MENSTELKEIIQKVDSFVTDPTKGLPEEIFLYISRLTPMVNVDLLIKNEKQQTLLTWRHDEFYHGWHVAGGIIRFKESFACRLRAVAEQEFGAKIEFDPAALGVFEKINATRDTRGHFIAHLYRCYLTSPLAKGKQCLDINNPKHGQWYWHNECPEKLIPQHEVYRKYINP